MALSAEHNATTATARCFPVNYHNTSITTITGAAAPILTTTTATAAATRPA